MSQTSVTIRGATIEHHQVVRQRIDAIQIFRKASASRRDHLNLLGRRCAHTEIGSSHVLYERVR